MQLLSFLIASSATITILPGILAVPAPNVLPNLQPRAFTFNPDANPNAEPRLWPDHKMKYRFKNNDSKKKLAKVVKDAWQLWLDAGVNTDNIDLVESTDNDALVIEATKKLWAKTTIGKRADNYISFGTKKNYGMLNVVANMAHEMGHGAGFYQEHQRYDRNGHINFECES